MIIEAGTLPPEAPRELKWQKRMTGSVFNETKKGGIFFSY